MLARRVLGDHPVRHRLRAVLGIEVGIGEGIVGTLVTMRRAHAADCARAGSRDLLRYHYFSTFTAPRDDKDRQE